MNDREFWEQCCRKVAAANDLTYEQVVAELEAGRAALEFNLTLTREQIEAMQRDGGDQ